MRPDGLSIDRAIRVKSRTTFEGIREEFAIISRKHGKENVQWKLTSQALLQKGGKHYDEIRITTNDGEEITYYFDLSRFFGKT